MTRRSSRACWPGGCGCWSAPTPRVPTTGARSGRTTTQPDGTLLACAHLGGAYAAATARWRVVPSRSFRALYNYLEPGAEPDPARRRGHTPLFHDPETGALHNETLSRNLGLETAWRVASRGWVQASWPRAMKTACPGLAVPAGLPVNERQTSTAFGTMMAQDPEAPVRNAPGSHLRGPGATGIAAAQGRPRQAAGGGARPLPGRERRLRAHRHRRRAPRAGAGRRRATSSGCSAKDGGIADTGVLVPSSDGTEIAVHYRRLPIRPRYRIGDALPFLPDGRAVRRDAHDRPAGVGGNAGGAALRRHGCLRHKCLRHKCLRRRRDRAAAPAGRRGDRRGRRHGDGAGDLALVARRARGDAGGERRPGDRRPAIPGGCWPTGGGP